jgi:tellurite resistance protein TerB
MSKREEYQHRMEEELDLWSARFDALRTKAGKEAKAEIAKQLERWGEAKEAATAKLAELKATVGDKWDLVKAELDKAWHGIQEVLDEGVPRVRHLSKEEIEGLTPEQQDGILEALVMAAIADGKVGADEIARFDVEIGKVPWIQPKEEILKKAQAAQARILALANVDERTAMLKGIAARLPPGPVTEKTLGMMALVMAADGGLTEVEKGTLGAIAEAFGVTKERLHAITLSLRGA